MVRNWKNLISKIALGVGLACVLGTMLAQAPMAYAETSEPKNVPVTPPMPVEPQLAKKCANALKEYQDCLFQQSSVSPPDGRGVCDIFIHEWKTCSYQLAKDSNEYNEQARSYWYMRSKQITQAWEFKLKVALIGGVLDALGLVAQRLAYETAQLILTGGDSQEPMFWNQPFGTWLKNTAELASSEFLYKIDEFVQEQALGTPFEGISLCRPPNPLMIKMNLGMGRLALLNPRGQCTLSQLADNFEAVSDMVQSGDALAIERPQFYEGGPANDLSVGLSINNSYLNYTTNKVLGAELARVEGQGMKQITDKITGQLQYPSVLANNSMMNLDPVAMAQMEQNKEEDYMIDAFWQAGLEGIGFITLKVFINTMALGILHKIFDPKKPLGEAINASPEQMSIQYEALKNADAAGDAQNLFERQDFAKSLGDFVVPNFNTTADADLVNQMSTCVMPRTRWNCSMDQSLATAMAVATADGALTVGKASGVGSENAKSSGQANGLHPEWELIPESDIKNNTDPSCYQRAYCAGNLKKLRLARILPIGWEMAANSPYNIKKDGKYITLGDVIRGFYDCNDQGQLDKDHPWCHLIDPNWILTAPRYQCRAKGYGDVVDPQTGARQEDCGDMASCLSTDVKGECSGGYGYCLAERPVYRFEARTCEAQYASCRTWIKPDGQQLSALRYTVERGNCSEDNIGCQWYATRRYVTSTASPDGLWVGTVTSGPRVYLDKGVQTCTTEGCTKVFRVTPGEASLNLVQNGSFEQVDTALVNGVQNNVGVTGWKPETACSQIFKFDQHVTSTAVDNLQGFSLTRQLCNGSPPEVFGQHIQIGGGRNYTLTIYAKSSVAVANTPVPVDLMFYQNVPSDPNGKLLTNPVTAYESCAGGWNTDRLKFKANITTDWQPYVCQFVTPPTANFIVLHLNGLNRGFAVYDSVKLEEGEYSTRFVDGVVDGLQTAYLKIPPQEYGCTGNDKTDHPACKRFARVCRQIDVGCQGYKDVEDPSAPEIPATLSSKDLCPSICAGYGRYEKLASSFDLVRNANPKLDDPEDQSTEYFIPSLAEQCTLADVGCEAFTSMEAATSTGEEVAYFNELRYCQKPNDKSTTYYTWEGSDTTGYQLVTWALIREQTGNGPMVMLTGGRLGMIKDPETCNESTWKDGLDPDCRQFYDEKGVAYYRYYSQTVTSDVACTKYRKDDSTQADCIKTGGTEFVPQTKSCMYDALPSQSSICRASAGGCRAYLGPTGRNAVNVFNEAFVTASSLDWFTAPNGSMKFSLSKEAVLVGDTSVKMEPTPSNGPIKASMVLSLPSTSTLYRISFWGKAASNTVATVAVDGKIVGQFSMTPQWQRYEFGPFYATGTAQQSSQNMQKHCGSFAYTATQELLDKYNGLDQELIDASVKATLDSLLHNPSIPKNVASIEKSCTDDTQCNNIPVYATDNTTVYGNTTGGKCGFAVTASGVDFAAPANTKALYIDTLRVDQLNDTQFVRKRLWSIPAACDATYPEGVPEARAMVGCREYTDRDNNTVFVRSFGSLCNADAIGCKGFIDTHDKPSPYPQTITVKGTPGQSQRSDGIANRYEDQYFGDWSVTSQAYRYFYAIDDDRAHCDSGEASCRAFGKPVFSQDRLSLVTTTNMVSDADADVYANQMTVNKFETVLMKDAWESYLDDNGQPSLACRKDELFCNRFQSGNVTEYFRDPGTHACVWQKIKQLDKNEANGIPAKGNYGGWFREGTDIPCYPSYQKNGDTFGIYYAGEDPYAGWVGKCPADQSECTEFVDPNDASDPSQPSGRSYYLINSNKIDTQTCGGKVDPLSGCVLLNNKSVSGLQASSKATYAKVVAEKGAAQSPIDCDTESDNPYCHKGTCSNLQGIPRPQNLAQSEADNEYAAFVAYFAHYWPTEATANHLEGKVCRNDSDCFLDLGISKGTIQGECLPSPGSKNDSNIIVKVKLDRECARWMSCRTGETVFDPAQQKFVTQCAQMQLCQKNGSRNDDVFCAQFTDRNKEDFLLPGQFVNAQSYSKRNIGFGSMDYSGLTIPDAYLVADIEAHNVGADLLGTDAYNGAYKHDKRLIARIPMRKTVVELENDPTFTNTQVQVCQDRRTNRYGYASKDLMWCFLPISEAAALSVNAGGTTGNDVSRDIQSLYKEFLNKNVSRGNSTIQSAMPEPECQLYPEVDSPVPNEYVAEWNNKVQPPIPIRMQEGYENVKACVYGEDCSCSYRKARYDAGGTRYYSAYGTPPSVGVCLGGDDAGLPCVPGGYIPVDSKNKVLVQTRGDMQDLGNNGCRNGMCVALLDVVLENGRYGYCLERDKTRSGNVSQTLAPCLTWSPLSVLGGKYDTTHYSPTAGYLPPQGSGEYYCVTGANSQKLYTPSPLTLRSNGQGQYYGSYFVAPGYLDQLAFDRSFVGYSLRGSDDILNYSFSNPESDKITGSLTQSMMFACRRTSVCEGYSPIDFDYGKILDNALSLEKEARWIQTGANFNQSYMEYFIPYIRQRGDGTPGYAYQLDEDSYDFKFGLFKFSIKPYAAGAACKWNTKWMGVSLPAVQDKKAKDKQGNDTDKQDLGSTCQGYLSSIDSLSQNFYNSFSRAFPGILDRSSESLLTDAQNKPIRLGCVDNPDELAQTGSGQNCYFKYWQTGFQYSNQEAFVWADRYKQANPDSTQNFNLWKMNKSRNVLAKQCQSDKPYFVIRAMFQNMNRAENNLSEDDAASYRFKGPWQFVGFWFTTCLPQSGLVVDPGLLYMQLDIVTADVCREVGQVVAPNTRESAAFADRVWSNGQFVLPILGLEYGSRNQPFGSAIATGGIGHDPMILGASVPLAMQKGGTAFADSGQGIQPLLMTQQNSWAPLTNLFAKVYKIYRWESSLVNKLDWVCVGGDNQGKNCTPPAGNSYTNHYQAVKTCTNYSACDPNVDTDIKNQNWRCNTLSGVNRGLSCGTTAQPRNLDEVCHNSAVAYAIDPEDTQPDPKLKNRVPITLYGRCEPEYTLDYYLSPSDLSGLGVCAKKFSENNSCAMTICDANNTKALQNLSGSCASESNLCHFQQDLCSPLMEQINNDLQNGEHSVDIYTPLHLKDCIYTDIDDLFGNGPRIYFEYKRSQCDPNLWFIKPKPDGLHFDVDSQGYILREQSVLALIYMALKWGSSIAEDKGKSCERMNNVSFHQFISKFEDSGGDVQWINSYLASDFPSLRNAKIKPAMIKSVRRYWGQYGSDTPLVKSLTIHGFCAITPGGDVKIPDASKSPIKNIFNFGPFDRSTVQPAAVFRCKDTPDKPVVNPGARCGGESDESVDCPVKIEACTNNITPGLDFVSNDLFYRTVWKANPSTGNNLPYRVPKCGFCTFGQGREAYQDMDPYKTMEGFKDTGYCFGFNPLSRCKTDADCRFTEYEFWGAHDNGKGEGFRFGTAEPNMILSNKEISEGAKQPFSNVELKSRRLPTPLFDDGQGGAMTEVPEEYSKPSVLSPAGHDTGYADMNFRGGDSLKNNGDTIAGDKVYHFDDKEHFGVLKRCDNDDCADGDEFECDKCGFRNVSRDDEQGIIYTLDSHVDYPYNLDPDTTVGSFICPIKPWYTICRQLAEQGDYRQRVADDPFDTDTAGYREKKAHIYALYYCMMLCNATAFQFPNSYAFNFDRIVNENRNKNNETVLGNAAKGKKAMRMAAVAPFSVNPLMRMMQTLGFRVYWQVGSQYADYVIQFAKGLFNFGNNIKIDMTGKMFDHMPFNPNIIVTNYSGTSEYYIPNRFLADIVNESRGLVNLPSILDSKPFFVESLNQIVGNEAFPWDTILFSQSIFPLALGSSDYPPEGKITPGMYNYYHSQFFQNGFIQFSNYWQGYGVPASLYAATQKVLKALADKGNTNSRDLDDFYKSYKFGMRDDFFDKTGWGIFMNPADDRLKLYPGAMQVASPSKDTARYQNVSNRPYEVFIPGHCEPPVGGTDSDTVIGKYVSVKPYDSRNAYPGSPDHYGDEESSTFVRFFFNPWVTLETLEEWNKDKTTYYNEKGLLDPDTYEWIPSYITPDPGRDGSSYELPGPSEPSMQAARTICRCIGGSLDGQIVESESQCNPRKKPVDNPDNFNPSDTKPDWLYCKPATYPGEAYADAMSYYVGKNVQDKNGNVLTEKDNDGNAVPMSYGVTQSYIQTLKALRPGVDPIPECYQAFGNPNTINPDDDNNACTHSPGYMPRNDVCKDGRDQCLLSYDLTDPVSVNNNTVLSRQNPPPAWAPTATDVSGGLDAFGYISGGNTNLRNGEYISWYRPRPPRIAAPDTTKSAASANAQPVIYLDSFNLNSNPEGLTFFGGGQGLATIQFYAWAAHNQTPLTKVVIDWGDGTVQTIDSAQLKNNKPLCGKDRECEFVPGLACSSDADCPPASGACVPTGTCKNHSYKECTKDEDCGGDDKCNTRIMFGNSNDACRQGFMEFQHVYTCDKDQVEYLLTTSRICTDKLCENQPDLTCADCRVDEKCVSGIAPSGGCYNKVLGRCRYTPKIQLYDSWGWCTGDCSQPNEMTPGGASGAYPIRHPFGGCYDGSNTKINSDIMCAKKHPYSCTLPNECDMNINPKNKTYRPWIVYKGSVEVAPVEAVKMWLHALEVSNMPNFSEVSNMPNFSQIINP